MTETEKTYRYKYPKPSVTTDCILLREVNKKKQVLLIKRKHEPFKEKWALPGGFVEIDEDLLEGAKRELAEETGIDNVDLNQFKTYGTPGRDPRGRTISIVYHGKIMDTSIKIEAGDDAAEASWFNIEELPPLAFDHETILKDFLGYL